MTKVISAFLLVLLIFVLLLNRDNKKATSTEGPKPTVTVKSPQTGKTISEETGTHFYDLQFTPHDYVSPYYFYVKNDTLDLWNRTDSNKMGSASLLNVKPTGKNVYLTFTEAPLPKVPEGYVFLARATSDSEEFVFYQQTQVCGDACMKSSSDVDIYYKSFIDSKNKSWKKLSATPPFKTPKFTNFTVFIHNNYLYVLQIEGDEKITQTPVYRAQIQKNGDVAAWEKMKPLPNIKANAFAVSRSLVLNKNDIYLPFANDYTDNRIYKGSIGTDGQISIATIIDVPYFNYLFIHNNDLHFVTNKIAEDRTNVTDKVGKIVLEEGKPKISYYPEHSIPLDYNNSGFDSWNVYYKGKLYSLDEARNFDTRVNKNVLVIQTLP